MGERIMISVDQEYTREVECVYKAENYRVRDNGAIMRVAREGKPKRPKDNIWTFGDKTERGYAMFCGVAVHRIVAIAFLGTPPSDQHVVDHIDTNRQNNRPENLRWLTKLENVLLNPITRAKIEYLCGSVESFLEDPSQLSGHENENSNFTWMRAVSPEEARNTLLNWGRLLDRPRSEKRRGENTIDEWIFKQNFINDIDLKPVADAPQMSSPLSASALEESSIQSMSASNVEEKVKETSISKTEFMKAVVDICKSENWNYETYYKTEKWNADILISVGDMRFALCAYNSVKKAEKNLFLMAEDGVKSFALVLSPKGEVFSNKACFVLYRNENVMEVAVGNNKISLAVFVKK